MSFKPSIYQLQIFDTYRKTNKNIVISAVPGSGKTTTILELLKFVPAGKTCVFVAFNKSIVNELKDRVRKGVKVATLHSIGAGGLYKRYSKVVLKENKTFGAAFEFVKKWGIDVKKNGKILYNVCKLVDLYRLAMCSSKQELASKAYMYGIDYTENELSYSIELFDYLNRYNNMNFEEQKFIDFTDMIYLPATRNDIELPQFDEVFVDECQDLNRLQQIIVKRIMKPGGRFVAVGDVNQTIYSFLFANPESFNDFKREPNTISLPLSVCYRCGTDIVSLANGVFETIESPEKKEKGVVRNGSYKEVKEGDFVLCRNNLPLFELYLRFLLEGKKSFIKGKDIGKNLLSLVSEINGSFEHGMRVLKRYLDELIEELAEKGVKKYVNHPRYISLFEKINIIQILANHFGSFDLVKKELEKMFVEDSNKGIVLSTIHKSKGLESDSVFILRPHLIPSQYATEDWELRQEDNLKYVAITRARKLLVFINDF